MASQLNPYLSFNGNARQALEFYGRVFGAEPVLSTYGQFQDAADPGADLIMHGMLQTPDGYTLMAADTPPGMPYTPGNTMSISLSGDDGEALTRYWQALGDGGVVTMPLEKQAWGDLFGMCTDRFGITWLVNIGDPQAA